MNTFRRAKVLFMASAALLLWANFAFSATIIQENWDGFPSTWTCASGAFGAWNVEGGGCATLSNGTKNLRMGPGRTGGNAEYVWFDSSVPNGYNDLYAFVTWPANTTDMYNRFYMKIDTNLDKSLVQAGRMKLWRYYAPNNTQEIYLDIAGATLKTGHLEILTTVAPTHNFALGPISSIQDGNWHCVEVHIKLNTGTNSDGRIDYWLDGTLVSSFTGIQWFSAASPYFYDYIRCGVGNVSDEPWNNTTPGAFAFDDFIISTSYNGPIGSTSPAPTPADTTPPVVSAFSIPSTSGSLTFPVSSFTATDNIGVTGYLITESSTRPSASATGWAASAPTTYTATSWGAHTLYPWTKDAAGNVSAAFGSPRTVTCTLSTTTGNLLFSESFADNNWGARGWYDQIANPTITTTEHASGSATSLQVPFATGSANPWGAGAMRHAFTETDSLYVSYWQKYSSNWQEQAGGYGHHEIYLLTNQDTAYANLAFTHTTGYIETWGTAGQAVGTTPHISFQDSANIDQAKINVDLTKTTENRAADGCNGLLDNLQADCYDAGGGQFRNGKYLSGGAGLFTLGQWHHVEAFFKMNSIVSGKGVADGTVVFWLDGKQIFQNNAVLMRTGQYPNLKFNQFVIGPWLGNGSPASQTLWIDDLQVATALPGNPPSPPTNLRVISVTQ